MKDKINKELEDLGWASMRSLLDKELPNEEVFFVENTEGGAAQIIEVNTSEMHGSRGRKKWLGLLLLLCFVGCGIASLQLLKQRSVQDSENCNQPIAAIEENKGKNSVSEAVLDNQNFEKNSLENNKNLAFDRVEKSIINHDNKGIIHLENSKKSINVISQNIDNQLFKEDFADINLRKNLEKSERSLPINQSSNIIENSVVENAQSHDKNTENALRLPFSTFSNLDKIDLVDSFEVRNNTPQMPVLTMIKPIKNGLPIEWGVTAGIHSVLKFKDYSALNGYQINGFLSKNVARNWVISSGLGFRSTVANGDSLMYIQADTLAQSNKSVGTSSPSSASNLVNGTSVRLNRLRYIEMPLFVSYKLSKKWGISTGFKASYLISKNFITPDNSNVFSSNSSTSSSTVGKSSSNILYDSHFNEVLGLKRWDFSFMGALNYRISPHLNITAQYDLGLKNIFNKPNWVAYNRYLGLNIGYRF